jgi:hypothetical protein
VWKPNCCPLEHWHTHTHSHFPYTHTDTNTFPTHTLSTHTFHTLPFQCSIDFFPPGFVQLIPDTHTTHTNTPHKAGVQHSGGQHFCVHSKLFPTVFVLADLCLDTCAHQHIHAPHQASVHNSSGQHVCVHWISFHIVSSICYQTHRNKHTHTTLTQRCTHCGCSELEWMSL